MQVLDEAKRERILAAAATVFASKPFHKAVLSEVAELAHVGKGTLYTYFPNKEALYLGVVHAAFAKMVGQLHECVGETTPPREALERVIGELVEFATDNPCLFALVRTVPMREDDRERWQRLRLDIVLLIQRIIERGVAVGMFVDEHPELTAQYIPGMVRSVFLEKSPSEAAVVSRHLAGKVLKSLDLGTKECR